MLNISAYLQNRKLEPVTDKDERKFLLKELYTLYTSQPEKIMRKKANWSNYIKYLKKIKKADSQEQRDIFKMSRAFIKEVPENRFWFFVSHVKTKDLYGVKSICLDKLNRGESIGGFILGCVKSNEKKL